MAISHDIRRAVLCFLFILFPFGTMQAAEPDNPHAENSTARPRAREIGIVIGLLSPGVNNAITDVDGVLVGHHTVWSGQDVRTGVTAILPHGGNLFRDKVTAATAWKRSPSTG